jgi:MYXO-CTERM domain-containing protein
MINTPSTHRAVAGWFPASMRGLGACLPALLLLACGDGPGMPGTGEPAGAITGKLIVHIFNLGQRSETRYILEQPGGEQRELRFESPPELASGATVRVFGTDDGRAIAVSRFEVTGETRGEQGEIEGSQGALIDGAKKPSKRWAFILVDTGNGVDLSRQAATDRLFSDAPNSIRSYYREVSYGLQELSGDVLGPFEITPPADLCENFVQAAEMVAPMIEGTYDQYLWYFGSPIADCPWEGVAQLGTAAGPTQHSFYNASAQCVVLVQEPGHNFGMVHSSSLRCNRAGVAASMIAGSTDGQCSHSEYGNPYDPMGGGSSGSQCLHMNGVQKAYQGWLGGCNIVKAGTSGRFTIHPLEKSCNGVQMLQVPLPAARSLSFPDSLGSTLRTGIITSYYVELRAPIGLDAVLKTPRVLIVAAGDLREARLRGNPNWLIDTTPETASLGDASLGVGKTFSDPAPDGPKITLVSVDVNSAVIEVQLGAGRSSLAIPGTGTCSDDDDSPFTAPGPAECLASSGTAAGNPAPADAGASAAGADAGAHSPEGGTGYLPPPPNVTPAPVTDPAVAPIPSSITPGHVGGGGCRTGGADPAPAAGNLAITFLVLLLVLLGARRRRTGSTPGR